MNKKSVIIMASLLIVGCAGMTPDQTAQLEQTSFALAQQAIAAYQAQGTTPTKAQQTQAQVAVLAQVVAQKTKVPPTVVQSTVAKAVQNAVAASPAPSQ